MATFKNSESGRPAGDLGKLNPSHSELEALGNALKSQEFRAMLCDYAREVSDPKNKALARSEMFQMEADQAIHATFLTPNPGYVIKTSVVSNNNTGSGDQDLAAVIGLNGKVFVNICSDENIKDAFKRDNMSSDPQGRVPWGFPYSTAKPRRDVDKAGQECVVFDVLFNTNVIGRAEGNIRFRNMVNSTALEGIEAAFNLKLDRKRLRFPKLKFKGSIHTTVMRRPMTDQELEEYQESKTKTEDHQEPNLETVKDVVKKEPKYAIKYRHSTQDVPLLADHGVTDPCRPSEMIVEVSLPEMTSAKGIDLDVLEHLMTLESEVPVAYKLVLKLPYPVFEDQGAAKFDKSQHSLVVTLPVKAANKEPVSRLISTDSGIGLDFDNTEAEAVVIDDTAYRTNSDQVLEDQVRRNLPPYNCNIYEGLMVLTIPVQNVVVDSLDRQLLEGNKGYQLSFQTLGQGFVPMEYGFCLAFDFESEVGSCSLEDLEIEVWDNNMILQLCIPKSGCSNFCVGTYKGDLGDAMPLPRLEAVKDKCFMLNKDKRERLDSDDSVESSGHDEDEEAFKERHRSGDSEDSAISVSPPSSICSDSPSKRFLVTPAQVLSEDNSSNSKGLDQVLDSMSSIRGILKRQRCYSESQADILRMMSSMDTCTIYEEDEEDLDDEETSRTRTDSSGSKKSVRFNEIVQRQIYRSNSSILGQKNKNQKKADQKKRKTERRVSEGDVSSNHFDDPDDAEDYYDDEHTNDSGMASSMEEAGLVQTRHKIKTKTSGNRGCLKRSIGLKAGTSTGSSRFMDESSSDLIFDLDF